MKKSSRQICFIVNPSAGKENTAKLLNLIRREAEKRWFHFEIIAIRPEESVSRLARHKANHFDVIVACGGDGTVNSVVNGIVETNAVLGVLPIGTGNDFAKTIGLPKSFTQCFEILQTGNIEYADLIHYTGDCEGWCANTLGLGLDGLANYYSKSYRYLTGSLIYVLGALKAAWYFRGSPIRLTVDGKQQNDHYVMITACNGNWEGGKFHLAPNASIFDHQLDLVTIKKISLVKILFYLPFLRWGPASWMSELETTLCRNIILASELPLSVHADGEHIGLDIKNLNIKLKPGILQVITGY